MKKYTDSTLMGMTKSELIDYVRMCEHNAENANARIEQQARNIEKVLKEQPPREKGKWESVDDEWNAYYCTACREIWTLNDGTPAENNMNFCPCCGADMRR